MKILVAGGAGYIGSHVVLRLQEAGHEITVLDNLSSGHAENVPRDVRLIQGDILDRDSLMRHCAAERFDAVCHFAALKAAGASMTEPARYTHQNLSGSLNLIQAADANGIGIFIFSSSAAVYGEPVVLPMDETHPLEPTNFYGFTKLQIEQTLAWFHKLRGIRFASLRYFNAAGYDAAGRITRTERDPHNLVPLVMETAIGRREMLAIYGGDYETPDGTCIRDYVHVTDLADAHVAALERLAMDAGQLVLNLGTAHGFSVREVLDSARQVTGRAIPHRMTDRRAGDPARLIASFQKAQDVLGWQPVHSDLANILETAWSLYRLSS